MILVTMQDGMTREEAEEYLDFNVINSKPYGDLPPPIYMDPRATMEEVDE